MGGLKYFAVFAIFIKVYNAKYIVQSFSNCENKEMYVNTLTSSGIEDKNDKQYVKDVIANIQHDVGSNGKYIAHLASGNSRFPLTYKGSNICMDIKKYLGETWTILLKDVGLDPSCPIKKGLYTAKRALIDESKVPFRVPIKGLFTLTVNSTDAITKKPLICLIAIIRSV